MYRFSQSIDINYGNDYEEDWSFGISLQSGAQFEFLECYYTFVRGNNGHEEECLNICYYSDSNNKIEVAKKLELSLKTLSYFFLIPLFNDSYIGIKEVCNVPILNKSKSRIKVNKLEEISNKIGRFRKTRQLFDEVILIFYAGMRFHYMKNFYEDSFLNYFKIVEKICKYDYNFRKDQITGELNTQENQEVLANYLKEFLYNNFNIKYSSNKIYDLEGNIMKLLLNNINQDIFSKIIIYCKKNNIEIDVDMIGRIISIRNKIAHGEIVSIYNYLNEFGCINVLCLNIIAKKFFNSKYNDIKIECKAELIN